ncbi:deoxyribonuclease V [Actinocrinis sp.]|uniref:deoxyribonuclease V n=1 Tax=Actinocrinis sp. TaxID=1920516 RepID=UPI002D2F20B1|nr:deoxyribonuclease V [Actinocrinis sp.]HZP51372.1 deoxyribonuclease V [Actinocrinis sp.]
MLDEAAARAEQERLRPLVRAEGVTADEVRLIAGVDVAYAKDESVVAGAAVVLDAATRQVVDSASAIRPVEFPYIPGLLAFREIPALLDALAALSQQPDVIVCDGYGVAHPRRFGLACHLGVITDLPAFGVAKTAFIGEYTQPGPERGAWSYLTDRDEVIGRVLRTQRETKPVFVSTGHRIGLDAAAQLTLALAADYRLPETTRQADRLSRQVLSEHHPAGAGGWAPTGQRTGRTGARQDRA